MEKKDAIIKRIEKEVGCERVELINDGKRLVITRDISGDLAISLSCIGEEGVNNYQDNFVFKEEEYISGLDRFFGLNEDDMIVFDVINGCISLEKRDGSYRVVVTREASEVDKEIKVNLTGDKYSLENEQMNYWFDFLADSKGKIISIFDENIEFSMIKPVPSTMIISVQNRV